jgi:hypothetical protein
MDFLSAFDSAADEQTGLKIAPHSQIIVARLNEISPERYFGRTNRTLLRAVFCNVWPWSVTLLPPIDGDGGAVEEESELTTHMLDHLDAAIRRMVVNQICVKNGGLTLSQLEDLIGYMLASRGLTPSLLPLTPSTAEALMRSMSRWDDCSSEQFMDLMQAYYSDFLVAEDAHLNALKPHIDVSMEQWLAGRRPTAIEFMNKIGEMNSRMETLKERWTTGYLKQQGE